MKNVIDVIEMIRSAKNALDYDTANKLTAHLLHRWSNQFDDWYHGPEEPETIFLTYERSETGKSLGANNPYYDLISVGTATERVFIPVPLLSGLFIATVFQNMELQMAGLRIGERGNHPARNTGEKKSMAHLLEEVPDVEESKWILNGTKLD